MKVFNLNYTLKITIIWIKYDFDSKIFGGNKILTYHKNHKVLLYLSRLTTVSPDIDIMWYFLKRFKLFSPIFGQ